MSSSLLNREGKRTCCSSPSWTKRNPSVVRIDYIVSSMKLPRLSLSIEDISTKGGLRGASETTLAGNVVAGVTLITDFMLHHVPLFIALDALECRERNILECLLGKKSLVTGNQYIGH